MNSYANFPTPGLTSPAIIFAFLVTFIDEIGEIKDLTNKKVLLIVSALILIYFIYSKQIFADTLGSMSLKNIPIPNMPVPNMPIPKISVPNIPVPKISVPKKKKKN